MSFIHMEGSVSTRIATPNAYAAQTDSEECGRLGAAWSVSSWAALGKDRQKHSRLGVSHFKRHLCICDDNITSVFF